MTKGGVVVKAGNKTGAINIKEIERRIPPLKVTEPKKLNPRILIYDVDRSLEDDEIIQCIYQQKLEEQGITMAERNKGFRVCYKTGRRDQDVVNIVAEVDCKIREVLLEAGRVYIEFAACRVVDQRAITRCFWCQGYGHVTKVCKIAPGSLLMTLFHSIHLTIVMLRFSPSKKSKVKSGGSNHLERLVRMAFLRDVFSPILV